MASTRNTKRREKVKPQTFAKGSNLGRFILSTIVRSLFIFPLLFLQEDINHMFYIRSKEGNILQHSISTGEERML